MPEYERSAQVTADPDDTFRFLADPANLPRYVASMSLARPEQGDQLRVAAEVQGRHEEGDAHFSADSTQRRIAWGAEGSSGYRGSIDVTEADGGSAVLIRLHIEHAHDESEINRVLDETVSNIERLLG